jgi:hypothetical protein
MKVIISTILLIVINCIDAKCQIQEQIMRLYSHDCQEQYMPHVMSMIEESLMQTYRTSDMNLIPFKIENDHKIPLVSILFKNVDGTHFETIIDSCVVYTIAFADSKDNLKYIASFNCGLSDVMNFSKKKKKVYKKVMKHNPDALLYCRSFIDICLENGCLENDLLYLKNNTIYYYDEKPVTITDFISSLPADMRKNLNSVQVPVLYQIRHPSELYRKTTYRNTSDTIPANENMFKMLEN